MAATVVEFEVLSEDLSKKIHDIAADTFKAYFTNTAPSASADFVLSDLPTEIANGNGYTTGGLTVDLSISRTGNKTTYSIATAVTLTPSGGAIPAFRYIVFYNFTAAAKNLLAYYDHGASVGPLSAPDFYQIPAVPIVEIN